MNQPSLAALLEIHATAKSRSLTYAEVGATFADTLPHGYFHDARSIELGFGDEVFAAASLALGAWRAHRGRGAP